ncbi:MAG: type II secretion system protein [Phycisphaerales bacterium]|jgi:type II secretory pathway pseudopilin PulG
MKLKKDKAYSFVEVILIVMIISIFAVVAVPRFNRGSILENNAEAAARKIVTDLRLARRLAISDAANNTEGFELKMVGSSPYTGYEIENADTEETYASHTLDSGINISCPAGTSFIFGPLGNLITGSGNSIIVSAEGKSFTITIVPTTGIVKCIEN